MALFDAKRILKFKFIRNLHETPKMKALSLVGIEPGTLQYSRNNNASTQ